MAIDGTIGFSFILNDRRTVGIATTGNLPISRSPSIGFTDGVGANQLNRDYAAIRSLVAGADSVDLNGVLFDLYGSSVALVRVKTLYIKNLSAANPMTFGAASSNPWSGFLNATGTFTLPPGAVFMIATPDATGWPVVAGTGDILKVAGTGTDSYEIAFGGGLT